MSIIHSVGDFEKFKLDVVSREGSTWQFVGEGDNTTETCQVWKRKRHLGHGSYGQVWQEVWEDDHGDVHYRAVKTCSEVIMRANYIDYKRELAALAAFSRSECASWFVNFHGWWKESENLCVAMEYHRLGDLSRYATSELPEAELKEIAQDILQGLAIMHREGFVHRDIKPQNILVHRKRPEFHRWWVKIADFGTSKQVHADAGTALRSMAGTHSYCAPEILEYIDEPDEKFAYTSKVDLWSFGCVLFYLASRGQLPFSGMDLTRYCDGRIQFNYKNVSLYVNGVGVSFIKVLLSVDAQQRPTAIEARRHAWFTISDQTVVDSSHKAPMDSHWGSQENFNSFLDSTLSGNPSEHSETAELTTSPSQNTAHVNTVHPTSILLQESVDKQHHGDRDVQYRDSPRDLAHRMSEWTMREASHRESLVEHPLPKKQSNMSTIHPADLPSDKTISSADNLHFTAQETSQAATSNLLDTWLAESRHRIRRDTEAIHEAAEQGRLDVIMQLVRQGSNVHVKNQIGWTPLYCAARNGHLEVAKWLVEAGVDINIVDQGGWTPLHSAAYNGHLEVVKLLVEADADINIKNQDGRTPLHSAIHHGCLEVAEWLVEAGADININIKDQEGWTPLHYAAYSGQLEVVKWLVETRGADINIKNQVGKTPRKLAKVYPEIDRWLRRQEAIRRRSQQSLLPTQKPSRHEKQSTSTISELRKFFRINT